MGPPVRTPRVRREDSCRVHQSARETNIGSIVSRNPLAHRKVDRKCPRKNRGHFLRPGHDEGCCFVRPREQLLPCLQAETQQSWSGDCAATSRSTEQRGKDRRTCTVPSPIDQAAVTSVNARVQPRPIYLFPYSQCPTDPSSDDTGS